MKIYYVNNEKFICYVNKSYYKYSKDTINNLLVKIIKILSKKYNIDTYGNYDVKCHIDFNYGIILELDKEVDEFSKYIRKANLNITFLEEKFIYEINDYLYFKNKNKVYILNNKFYIKSEDCNYDDICEFCNKIIYGKDLENVI